MSAQLLLAPAAAGKTEYCIAHIQAARRDAQRPLTPIWIVLPNGANAQAFVRRLAHAGGALNVHAVTFYALYEELLAEAGQLVARLDDAIIYRFLREAAGELHAAGELNFFASIHTTPGFVRILHSAIQELKRARITPEEFAAPEAKGRRSRRGDALASVSSTPTGSTTRGRAARLEELARLYAAYQRRLIASNWADGEGQGWLAALALENDAQLARDWRLLVIDGFDEFNPTQLEVLRLLAARVGETLITLTGDPHADRLAQRRFNRARAALQATFAETLRPISLSPRLPLSPSPLLPATPLAHLEAALFEPAPRKIPADGTVEFIQAPTRADEVRAALRWLKARIVRDGFAPCQVALLARALEPYHALIQETAAEFGMPVYLSQGANLAANPAIAALLNLLALPLQDFPRRRVVDAWRSPYADWSAQGLAPGDAERLDAAARWGQVIAGREQWADTLTRLARIAPDETEVAHPDAKAPPLRDLRPLVFSLDDAAPLTAPWGAAAAALWEKFQAFAARLALPASATMRDYAAWLEALIGDDPELLTAPTGSSTWQTKVVDPVGADTSLRLVHCARANVVDPVGADTRERDVAALREFKNVLRALVLAEAALGTPRVLARAEFWTELRGAVQAASYRVSLPDDGASLLAAPVLAARGLAFRAVALVGLAEGEFPRAVTEDPLLREADRAALGLPPRLAGDEVTFFYEAVTRAREKLLLTRPYLAADGLPWEPSPYWEHLRQIVDAPLVTVHLEDALPPQDAASLAELLATAPSSAALTEEGAARLQAVAHGAEVFAARAAENARGPYEGDLSTLHTRLARDFPPTRPWSASRLEAYGACPFAFFTAHALGLEPRPRVAAGYDVRQLGTMYHAILETLFRAAPDPTDLDALLDALPTVARRVFDAAPETHGFRPTALWRQQRVELENILAETLRQLVAASDGWQPAYFERAFGRVQDPDAKAPPLVLRGADGDEIRLRGYIDRVDVNADGELRVVDYKSGSSTIGKNDLDAGRRVQLALYARAARDALQLGEPVAGLYWHIGAAKASSLKLETYPGGIHAALQVATQHALSHAARVVQGDFAPRPPEGGCPAWCPATAFCWRCKPKS